jgi:hypothetical protein
MGGLAMLGTLGLLVGCGGGDDDNDNDDGASDRAAAEEPAASSTTAAPTTTTTAPTTTTTAAPQVVYEVEGRGTVVLNYATSANPVQNREVTLPWSEPQAEAPTQLSMLVALTGSEGTITCRIRRGDEVLAEATMATGAGPLLSCDYPPSGLPPVTFP